MASTSVFDGLNIALQKLLKILECPVCLEVYKLPIVLCQNGHSICKNCEAGWLVSTCPMCRKGMTKFRNLTLEHIIETNIANIQIEHVESKKDVKQQTFPNDLKKEDLKSMLDMFLVAGENIEIFLEKDEMRETELKKLKNDNKIATSKFELLESTYQNVLKENREYVEKIRGLQLALKSNYHGLESWQKKHEETEKQKRALSVTCNTLQSRLATMEKQLSQKENLYQETKRNLIAKSEDCVRMQQIIDEVDQECADIKDKLKKSEFLRKKILKEKNIMLNEKNHKIKEIKEKNKIIDDLKNNFEQITGIVDGLSTKYFEPSNS